MLKKIEINQEDFYYDETLVEGSEYQVVLIHGLTGNHKSLKHFQTSLNETYSTYSVELFGRGQSITSNHESDIYKHVETLKTWIKKLNLTEIVLVGYSMGAFIAAVLASHIKVEKLVLLDGFAHVGVRETKIVEPSFKRINQRYDSKASYVEAHLQMYQNTLNKPVIESDWYALAKVPIDLYSQVIKVPTMLIICLGYLGNLGPLFKKDNYAVTVEHIKHLEIHETQANHYQLMLEKQPNINNQIMIFINNRKEEHNV